MSPILLKSNFQYLCWRSFSAKRLGISGKKSSFSVRYKIFSFLEVAVDKESHNSLQSSSVKHATLDKIKIIKFEKCTNFQIFIYITVHGPRMCVFSLLGFFLPFFFDFSISSSSLMSAFSSLYRRVP